MILGIHYFITKLKTKIDVIPRGCFKLNWWENNYGFMVIILVGLNNIQDVSVNMVK